jgi:tetratricopeptide (TPR) repeat protein
MSLSRTVPLALAASLFAVAPLQSAPADLKTLREQLALATEDKDTLSRIELLRRIVAVDPADAASHRLLVELWLEIKDYDLAEATLNAWPDAPPDLAALTRAAVLRYRDEDVPGAVRVLQDYLAKSPKDLAAHEALVDALLATKDYAAQLAALDAYIAVQRDVTNLIRRANTKLALDDFTGAIADARAAEALDSEADIVKRNVPSFERLEIALNSLPPLDATLEKSPRDLTALMQRAWWLRYGSLNARSLADANAALEAHPGSVAALVARERARWLLDQVESTASRRDTLVDVTRSHALESIESIAAADLALQKNPRDEVALRQRARGLNGAEQYLLAQRDADAALALDEKDADAALELLYATSLLGQDITPIFRRIEIIAPPKPKVALANAYLADLYFRQSNLPLALDYANRSLALAETEYVLRIKAAALQRLGRSDEAAAATKRANALHR